MTNSRHSGIRDLEEKLTVLLRVNTYDRLDVLKEEFEKMGTSVEIRTAEQRNNVVIANLDLTLL